MPECAVAQRMRERGSTDVDVRLFLTFTAAMDRARDADRLWFASERLRSFEPWAFEPAEVVRRQADLDQVLRQYGVSQRHGMDVAGWFQIGNSLADAATAPDVHVAIYEGRGDAVRLRQALRRERNGLPLFPFLRGPKVGPMWIRMLAVPGNARIDSITELPVAVDVQVRKVTEYLGVTNTRDQSLEAVRGPIQRAWHRDVRENGAIGPSGIEGTPSALDPALWFFAKWGCTFCERARRKLPISEICGQCLFEQLH